MRLGKKRCLPWEVNAAQQLPHPPLDLDGLSQSIGFCCSYDAGIAHLCKQLSNHIVVVFDLDRKERGTEEVFKDVDHAVEELEHEKRLNFCGGCREE